jgi:hypothetical protein
METENKAVLTADPAEDDRKDWQAAIDILFAQMKRIDEKIANDQADIEKLRDETRAMLAELRAAE